MSLATSRERYPLKRENVLEISLLDFSVKHCTAVIMAEYRILVFCTDCGRTHTARSSFSWDDGPTEKTTVAEAYKNKPLPLELAKLLKKDVLCPELAKSVMLKDADELYLVPILDG